MELLSLSLQDYPSEVDMKYPVFLVAVFNFSAVLLDIHHPLFDYIKISLYDYIKIFLLGHENKIALTPPPTRGSQWGDGFCD